MPKDRARQRTYGPNLVQEQAFPSVPPESVWAGLTETERCFILGYLRHGDVRQAFVDAGLFRNQKYPRQQGYEYLRRPKIQRAVARAQAFFAEQVGLHAWQILGALHSQALHDPAALYEEDGEGGWQLKPVAQWPLESRLAIQKIRVEESTTEHGTKRKTELEFVDRLHALQLLGRHLHLFEKKDRQVAPFTLILQHNPDEPTGLKQVGETISGIGLQIRMPVPDES